MRNDRDERYADQGRPDQADAADRTDRTNARNETGTGPITGAEADAGNRPRGGLITEADALDALDTGGRDMSGTSATARWRTALANHAGCGLSPSALALAFTVASRSEGGMVWSEGTWEATDEGMAKALGWDARTARRHRKALERAEWWVCERRGSKRGEAGVSSRYRLSVPAVCQGCTAGPNRSELSAWDESQPDRNGRPNRTKSVVPTGQNCPPKEPVELPVKEPPPADDSLDAPETEPIAAAPSVVESETNAPSAREEEELFDRGSAERSAAGESVDDRGRDADTVVTGPEGEPFASSGHGFRVPPISAYWVRRRGFRDSDEAARFFAEAHPAVVIAKRSGYLAGIKDLPGWEREREEWREDVRERERAEAEVTLAAVEARYGTDLLSRFEDLPGIGKLDRIGGSAGFACRAAFDAAVVTALGEALERGATFDLFAAALVPLAWDTPPTERPELLAWLAQMASGQDFGTGQQTALTDGVTEWDQESSGRAGTGTGGDQWTTR